MMRIGPPADLTSAQYEVWLKENPKTVVGGPILLEFVKDATDPDNVFFIARKVNTKKLPEHYARDLMISSESTEFSGFKIHVTPKGFDYLIAAHQHHQDGQFADTLGNVHEDFPHFHEWDYSGKISKKPTRRYVCPSTLSAGIAPNEFLETFLSHYYFDDDRKSLTKPPMKPRARQEKITDVK